MPRQEAQQPYSTWPDRSPRKGKTPSTRACCVLRVAQLSSLSHSLGSGNPLRRVETPRLELLGGIIKMVEHVVAGRAHRRDDLHPPAARDCDMRSTKLHEPGRRSAVRCSVAPWLRGPIGAGAAMIGYESDGDIMHTFYC